VCRYGEPGTDIDIDIDARAEGHCDSQPGLHEGPGANSDACPDDR
jgi:hypothetical protein